MDEENTCIGCEYYDAEEDVCGAFECYGFECTPLPCEEKEFKKKLKKVLTFMMCRGNI